MKSASGIVVIATIVTVYSGWKTHENLAKVYLELVYLSLTNFRRVFIEDFTQLQKHRAVKKTYTRYVALGDSLTEGLGDETFKQSRIDAGWADRFAGLLALEAAGQGKDFFYANLALRGKKIQHVFDEQLRKALILNPDIITIMAGQNDLLGSKGRLSELEHQLKIGIAKLQGRGITVLLANSINPNHLAVFRPLAHLAEEMSMMLGRVAEEMKVPLHDIHGIKQFSNLAFWASDMVHFSSQGHILVANRAAELLGLSHRICDQFENLDLRTRRRLGELLRWVIVDVIPFCWRRIRRVSSGDGLEPKLPEYIRYDGPRQRALHISSPTEPALQ